MENLTPRATRWSDTLLDLYKIHNIERFKELAEKVIQENVAVGIELTPAAEKAILQYSAEALRGGGGK